MAERSRSGSLLSSLKRLFNENKGVAADEARHALSDVVDRAREAGRAAREKVDVVSRREYEALARDVGKLRARVAELERRSAERGPPRP